ncbi:MarR family winged helix-turn-helix transcriptional regulator [Thalassospira alkalitolerans]|nr:MarR family transcriptional regulator [Thalassospira alkalitolerans]
MPSFHDPKQNIGFLMKDVTRLMRRNFMRRAHDFGLTQAQMQALAYLARNEGIRQVTLAEMLEIQPITTARLIDKLEEQGLVERRPDPSDRRAVLLYLTERAGALIDRIWVHAAKTREEALAGLSPETQEILVTALGQMYDNLTRAEQAQSQTETASADK